MDYPDLVDEGLKLDIQKKARADAGGLNYSPPQVQLTGNYARQLFLGAQNCVYDDAFHTRKLRLERRG